MRVVWQLDWRFTINSEFPNNVLIGEQQQIIGQMIDEIALSLSSQYAVLRNSPDGAQGEIFILNGVNDFVQNKTSQSIGPNSYLPGVKASNMKDVLPNFIYHALQTGIKQFTRRVKNYIHPEAIVVATESRTSSPVRIPRDKNTLQHIQINGLYPCAEGAGYAGGIVSAAIDGERVLGAGPVICTFYPIPNELYRIV